MFANGQVVIPVGSLTVSNAAGLTVTAGGLQIPTVGMSATGTSQLVGSMSVVSTATGVPVLTVGTTALAASGNAIYGRVAVSTGAANALLLADGSNNWLRVQANGFTSMNGGLTIVTGSLTVATPGLVAVGGATVTGNLMMPAGALSVTSSSTTATAADITTTNAAYAGTLIQSRVSVNVLTANLLAVSQSGTVFFTVNPESAICAPRVALLSLLSFMCVPLSLAGELQRLRGGNSGH